MIRALVLAVIAAASWPVAAAPTTEEAWRAGLDNRIAEAEELFESLGPGDPEAAFGRGLVALARGDDSRALDALLDVIAADASSGLAAAALGKLLELQPLVAGGGAHRNGVLTAAAAGGGGIDPEVADYARRALGALRLRAGEPGALERTGAERGSWPDVTIVGPFGRFANLALDRPFPPDAGDLEVSGTPPGPDGRRPIRIDTRYPTGSIVIPSRVPSRGVVYAAADLVLDSPRDVLLRIASPVSFRAFVNGLEVLHVDRLRSWNPWTGRVGLALPAGRHRLVVKLQNAAPGGQLSVMLTRPDGLPIEGITIGHPVGPVPRSEPAAFPAPFVPLDRLSTAMDDPAPRPAELLACALLAEAAGDHPLRRRALERAQALWPESALVRLMLGELYHYAPTGLAGEKDISRARAEYEAALEAAPSLARARYHLAVLEDRQGRIRVALDQLDRGETAMPAAGRWALARHAIAAGRGWRREAGEALDAARGRVPDSPDFLRAAVGHARATAEADTVVELTRSAASQDPTTTELAATLARAARHEEATAEWRRLIALTPWSLTPRQGLVNTLSRAGRYEEALEAVDEAIAVYPENTDLRWRRALLLGLLDRVDESEREMAVIVTLDPSRLDVARHLDRRTGNDPDLGLRVDAAGVRAAAPEPPKGVGSSLLLDQSIVRVDVFGGAVERYHAVIHVYTRAGVEQESQIALPPGARMLALRIVKPDGKTVEPPLSQGGQLALPNLEPGDFIEYSYERYQPPLAVIPGAFNNDALFVFQGGERPFVLSQYVLVHDEALDVEVHGRFGGLETSEELRDGLRIRSWTAREMPSLGLEPDIPNRFDVSPHVRVSMRCTWDDVADSFRNGWAGLLRPTAEMEEVAAEIAARHARPLDRARAVHEHVNETMRPGAQVMNFGLPASVSYSGGSGNRLLVAKTFLELLDVPHEVLMTRPVPERGTFTETPHPGLFGYPLIRVRDGDDTAFLDYVDADHPFDQLPFFVRGSDALVLSDEGPASIELLPRPEEENPLVALDADLALAADGTVSGSFRQQLNENAADEARESLNRMTDAEQGIVFMRAVNGFFAGAFVSDYAVDGLDAVGAPVTVRLQLEGGALGRAGDGSLAVPAVASPTQMRRRWATLERRRYPLLISQPRSVRETMRVTPPAGFRAGELPAPTVIDGAFGRFRLEMTADGQGAVIVRREIELPYQRIEPVDYPRFAAFAATIDRAEAREIRFLSADG